MALQEWQKQIKKLKLENKELRIAKNMLIDRVQELETRKHEKDAEILSMRNTQNRMRESPDAEEKCQKCLSNWEKFSKILVRIFNIAGFFFYCIENILYKSWMAIWLMIIAQILYKHLTGSLM